MPFSEASSTENFENEDPRNSNERDGAKGTAKGTRNPPPRRRVKRVRFGKLAFFLQSGAFFGPKIDDFRPFRTTF